MGRDEFREGHPLHNGGFPAIPAPFEVKKDIRPEFIYAPLLLLLPIVA